MSETLVRVVGRYFVAGLVVSDDRCIRAAPILRKACMGKTADQLREMFRTRGWQAHIVPQPEAGA